MNYFMKLGVRALLLFSITMMSFSNLQAEDIESPDNLIAQSDFNNEIPENFFYLTWIYGTDDFELIDGFKLYVAPGDTEDESQFELLETFSKDDDRIQQQERHIFAMIQTFDSAMNYSFYLTAYIDSDESDRSNFALAKYKQNNQYYVRITNYFPETVAVDEEVSFTPEVETNFPDPEYSYELIYYEEQDEIEGLEIDEETGEITWTPTEGGYYFFGVAVEVTNSDNLSTGAMFRVFVSECSELATVTLNVTDEDGNPIEMGEAVLQTKKDEDGKNYGNHGAIIEGNLVFDNVQKGDYELVVFAYGYYTYWYDGKTGPEDADIISVDCADDLTFDITLTERVNYYINITNDFPTSLKVGEEVVFTPEVETNYPDPEFEFEFFSFFEEDIPDDMEFDEETGTITWTPTEGGFFEFGIEVRIDELNYVHTNKIFRVNVSECDVMATLNLSAVMDDEQPIDSAFAYLISVEEGRNKYDKYYETVILNGEATFDEVDKGTYYLAIIGHGFREYWYEDAYDFWSATPIEIDCGDVVDIDAIIEKMDIPEKYNISGTVTDEETGDPIEFATVTLISVRNNKMNAMNATVTDASGNYSFYNVHDNMDYIVRAEKGSFIFENDTTYSQSYIPEYYDDVTDISEALVLELTEDITDVDFELAPVPEYENSISGTVEGEDGSTITDGFVVGFLIDTDSQNKGYMYYGVTSSIMEGTFNLEKLIPGQYILLAFDAEMNFVPGYYVEDDVASMKWKKATQITVDEDSEITDISITLQDRENMWGGGIVKGRINKGKEGGIVMGEEPNAEPLNGAMIYLTDENGKMFKAGESNESGQFSLEDINYGTYVLVADKVGFDSYETTIILDEDNKIVEADISLQEEGLTSVDDLYDSSSNAVFPNPASDMVNISFKAYDNNSIIKLTDLTGNELMTKDVSTTLGINTLELNVSDYSAGAYFFIIKTGERQVTLPVIIK